MSRKKLVSTVFAFIMLTSLTACVGNEREIPGKTLYGHGQDVVSVMVEATLLEEYVQTYTGSTEIVEIVQSIGTGDYTTPKAVYCIKVSDETLIGLAEVGNMDGASESLRDTIKDRVFGSLMTQINGMSGVNNLAASSVCTMGKTFVNEEVTENQIYLYTYENGKPVAVTFVVGEDGSVSASGTFVMYDAFTCGSAEEIKHFFREFEVKVEEVYPSK